MNHSHPSPEGRDQGVKLLGAIPAATLVAQLRLH